MGKIGLAAFLLAIFSISSPIGNLAAQPAPVMEYLGEAHVDGGRDHDEIKVTAARGPLRAIQIFVDGGAIHFGRVIVHYGDGEAEPITLRSVIPAGQQTRVIQLSRGPRIVRSVEFFYARTRWRGPRPRVRLMGSR